MNGILRCKGRLCNSSLPESAKFPSWLPCDHHITRLTSRDSPQGEQSSALDIRERGRIYGVLYNACFPWNSNWYKEGTGELHWRRHQRTERREPRTCPSRTEGNAFATMETGRSSRWRKEETANQCLEPLVKLTELNTKLCWEHLITQVRNS